MYAAADAAAHARPRGAERGGRAWPAMDAGAERAVPAREGQVGDAERAVPAREPRPRKMRNGTSQPQVSRRSKTASYGCRREETEAAPLGAGLVRVLWPHTSGAAIAAPSTTDGRATRVWERARAARVFTATRRPRAWRDRERETERQRLCRPRIDSVSDGQRRQLRPGSEKYRVDNGTRRPQWRI